MTDVWTAETEAVGRSGGIRVALVRASKPASYAEVIDAWRSDAAFREWFNGVLASAPFTAFRWETRPVSTATANDPFEFVLLDSPGLAREPDVDAFAEHFEAQPDSPILAFSNLGGDAIMVVPRPLGRAGAYGHLAAFLREAPESQRAELWRAVGDAMVRRLGPRTVWLSTAGAGVSWLHVRLDDRPKYYGFAPYRTVRA